MTHPEIKTLTLYPICYILNIASFSINNSNFQIFSKKEFLNYNSFENIMEMEHLLLRSECSIFHNYLKNLTFQRRPKALVRSKELIWHQAEGIIAEFNWHSNTSHINIIRINQDNQPANFLSKRDNGLTKTSTENETPINQTLQFVRT